MKTLIYFLDGTPTLEHPLQAIEVMKTEIQVRCYNEYPLGPEYDSFKVGSSYYFPLSVVGGITALAK